MDTTVRLSPQVQKIQSRSRYTDIYTNAVLSPLRSRPTLQPAALVVSHTHPEPKRWENPGGWGARHMNDKAPFDLWNKQERFFRSVLLPNEVAWINKNLRSGEGGWGIGGWCMYIETNDPPQPVPLTVGCMPVVFVPIGSGNPFFKYHHPIENNVPAMEYIHIRMTDPCSRVRWPRMTFPSKEQNVMVLTALQPLANIRAILYFPDWIIVELEYGDNRVYNPKSLPGKVAGRNTFYVHTEEPFFKSMGSKTRTRTMDPATHPLEPNGLGPTPQDDENYLRNQGRYLSPGCRVECVAQLGESNKSQTASTSAGVKLRSNGREVLTVAHHGFLTSPDVYHPYSGSGGKIGQVIDNRPELDIAFVELTLEACNSFRNDCYFQAETPRGLLSGRALQQGSWHEVDGMSSGLVSLLHVATDYRKAVRPPGHPEVPFHKWKQSSIACIFGVCTSTIADGMCGAPIVSCEDGGVSGFFHLSDGIHCYTATLDDLIAEGWMLA